MYLFMCNLTSPYVTKKIAFLSHVFVVSYGIPYHLSWDDRRSALFIFNTFDQTPRDKGCRGRLVCNAL